jgi:hypothetical protein
MRPVDSRTASGIAMAEYVSDITRFMQELKQKTPELEQKQREGRAIWWDKQLDADQQARWQASRVPQPPYVYQSWKK